MNPAALVPFFLARRHTAPLAIEAALEASLAEAFAAGVAAWPAVALPADAFVAYLADRTEAGGDPIEAVRGLRAGDLYLACACARGDAKAISAFERAYLTEVGDVLARMGLPASVSDDAKQILRRRFFVGEEGRAPRIVDYEGRGPLRRWVKASAVRVALRIVRRERGSVAIDASVLGAVSEPAQDLELDFLKRTYGKAFEVALREAFESLRPRDRNLLRYYFGKKLSIDELGVLYRVHRATAARRLQKANAELVSKTRDRLAAGLGIAATDVSSIVRLIQSQIERTLSAILSTGSRAT
jgi:RNA polymerase sigma-70 factor (ECF subfamily)